MSCQQKQAITWNLPYWTLHSETSYRRDDRATTALCEISFLLLQVFRRSCSPDFGINTLRSILSWAQVTHILSLVMTSSSERARSVCVSSCDSWKTRTSKGCSSSSAFTITDSRCERGAVDGSGDDSIVPRFFFSYNKLLRIGYYSMLQTAMM